MAELKAILEQLKKMDAEIQALKGAKQTGVPVAEPAEIASRQFAVPKGSDKRPVLTTDDRIRALYAINATDGETMISKGTYKARERPTGRNEPLGPTLGADDEAILNSAFDPDEVPDVPADSSLPEYPLSSDKKKRKEFMTKWTIFKKMTGDENLSQKQAQFLLRINGPHITYLNAVLKKMKGDNFLVNSIGTDNTRARLNEITRELGRFQAAYEELKREFDTKTAPIRARMEELKSEKAALQGRYYEVSNKFEGIGAFTQGGTKRVRVADPNVVVAPGFTREKTLDSLSTADLPSAKRIRKNMDRPERQRQLEESIKYVQSLNAMLPITKPRYTTPKDIEELEVQRQRIADEEIQVIGSMDIIASVEDRLKVVDVSALETTYKGKEKESAFSLSTGLTGPFAQIGIGASENEDSDVDEMEVDKALESMGIPTQGKRSHSRTQSETSLKDQRYLFETDDKNTLTSKFPAGDGFRFFHRDIAYGRMLRIKDTDLFNNLVPTGWPTSASFYRGDGKNVLRPLMDFYSDVDTLERFLRILKEIKWSGCDKSDEALETELQAKLTELQAPLDNYMKIERATRLAASERTEGEGSTTLQPPKRTLRKKSGK